MSPPRKSGHWLKPEMLRENDMPGGWVAVFVLCLLLAGAVYGAYEGWTAHSGDVELPGWGYALLGVGVIFGLVIGCGLMALAFYSSRSGHDERTVFKQQEDRDGEDRH
jgi:hypothetical protein